MPNIEQITNEVPDKIIVALNLQKKGGNFIIKCFDLTNELTIKIFYILCHLYEKTIITKLKTSRKTNFSRNN